MKKIFLIIVAPFAFSLASMAQITQTASDSIVLERMSADPRTHTVYAKTDGATISTAAGELLELNYSSWIYYIRYDDQTDEIPAARHYFVVKESSGNLLEVNTKNDVSPDLTAWRIVPDCPMSFIFKEYTLAGTSCQWTDFETDTLIIVNSDEELESYISCTGDNLPSINFSKYSLLLVRSLSSSGIEYITKNLQQTAINEYELDVNVFLNDLLFPIGWTLALITCKLEKEADVKLTIVNALCAEQDLYYYYDNPKIFLQQRTDKILLTFADSISEKRIESIINSDISLNLVYKGTMSSPVFFLESKDEFHIPLATLEFFKTRQEIVAATYLFQIMPKWSDMFSGITDEFIVKLKPTTSYAQLQTLVEKNKCKIKEKSEYEENKFLLSVSKITSLNALQMANLFQETGLFEFTQPNFVYYNILFSPIKSK